MHTLLYIRRALSDRRLQVVADATGLHVNTLRKIRDDPGHMPNYSTYMRLNEYLEAAKR